MKMEKNVIVVLLCLRYWFSSSPLYIDRLHQDLIKNISTDSCTKFGGTYNNKTKTCSCSFILPDLTSDRENVLSCRRLGAGNCQYFYKNNITSREIVHLTTKCLGSHFFFLEEGTWSSFSHTFIHVLNDS